MSSDRALSKETKEIVKATAPVLAEHGEKITSHFYQRMFSNHPELLNVFNQTNQKKGRQPQALANAIYAAAVHIDHLETILPAVKQIAHKHRSLNIMPEQYPIVGENILAAIKEVLGEAATDDIINAWGEAYGVIADVFIQVEKEMYEEAEQARGGWKGFRPFIVEKKVVESDVITSFYLKPADGKELADFLPGQYMTLKAKIEGEEYTHMRQYSLSDAPGNDYYRISVKRESGPDEFPSGKVSNYLHKDVKEGDILEYTAPAGDFVLDQDSKRPVVFISGGVGLTPLMSMFNTLVKKDSEREITFIHAAINGQHHAMHEHVATLAKERENIHYALCFESPTQEDTSNEFLKQEGFIDKEFLRSVIETKEADFYFCGPVPFMKAVNYILKSWDVPEEHIHFEFFGPAQTLEG
ncbi:NO-inducible flavohemoprotein [Bacillus sp. FJAT-44742]|uniref:NO-inducible flavohemoprotein n=1 Tax=Bacillus sp. FJAT-44742 TaxID=2014005 RepID=UPI000C24D715|nr:NO-inducible flavohemoprotein [Bacillus sp. FJAT-44742]